MYDFVLFVERPASVAVSGMKGGCPMHDGNLPAWAIGIGAEVRDRTSQLPINEPYLVDVSELLRAMSEREVAERRRRCGREEW
jgi:hypothetical protein